MEAGTTQMRIDKSKIAEAGKLRKSMRADRFRKRNIMQERLQKGIFAPQGAPCVLGLDSEGKQVHLKKGQNLKIGFLESGLVQMGTGLKQGWAGKRKIGGVPATESITDVYSATRKAIHIQEQLASGREERDAALDLIEKMNSELNKFGEKCSPLWLHKVKLSILGLSERLQNTVNPLNQEAWAMLEKAAEAVRQSSVEGSAFSRRNFISVACANLTAFRNRLGEWRDGQVEGMIVYNKKRECVLRLERDQRVWNAIARMAKLYSDKEKKWAVFGRDMKDLRYAERMEEIAAGRHRAKTKMEFVSELIKEMEKQKYAWGRKGFRLEFLKEAKENYERGETECAGKLLRRAKRVLELNKPEFLAGQLELAEEYMKPVAEKVREGTEHIAALLELPHRDKGRGEHLEAAAECFREALLEMGKIGR